jgi:hypothetical protein
LAGSFITELKHMKEEDSLWKCHNNS